MTHLKKHLQKKGFTLIEVLIVVVIIGILASLVLPRMLAQPERAITAEGFNYLGVIRRAQDAQAQPNGVYLDADSGEPGGSGGAPNGDWMALGLSTLSASSRFTYTCSSAASTCTSTRTDVPANNARSGGTITMSIDSGFVTACGAPYQSAGTLNSATGTCV